MSSDLGARGAERPRPEPVGEAPGPAAVSCRQVTVAYETVEALRAVDLEIPAGRVMALLGPSGAGKSTMLHAIAGFVLLAGGEIAIGGEAVATPGRGLPPERRSVGMVFQHYALWPHLEAADIVAYPLRRRGVRKAEARRRAVGLLDRMGIADLADRRPETLSGGQQQRVGLARALAREPAVYLFDEPTAHLDTALRQSLQEELAARRQAAGAAAVYATHDAAEALAISDTVVLLREGEVVQRGSPREVYSQPVDLWSARLTGPASLLDAQARLEAGGVVRVTGGGIETAAQLPQGSDGPEGQARHALVRPEWASLGGPLPATVSAVWYRGPHSDYRLDTPFGAVELREPGAPRAAVGERCGWSLRTVWPVP